MNDPITLPDTVPVMPLPGALLFPRALLPLYIFEPRYREMLDRALSDDRMLCVALIDPKRSEWRSVNDFRHVATIGLIRACVGRGDGTSNLILQGLQRVRFTSFTQEKPFPIAAIEPVESVQAVSQAECFALSEKILQFYARLKNNGHEFPDKIDTYLSDPGDPELLADLMATTFISDPLRRQQLLEERSVTQRLRLVIRFLEDETDHPAV